MTQSKICKVTNCFIEKNRTDKNNTDKKTPAENESKNTRGAYRQIERTAAFDFREGSAISNHAEHLIG